MQKESKAIWNTFWVDPISRYLLYEKRTFCRRIRKFLFKYAKIFTFWFLSAYISIIFTRNYSLFLNIFPYLWSHVPERFFFSFYSLFVLADLLGEFIFIFFPLSRLLSQFYSLCFVYFDNAWDVVMPQFRYFCGIEIKMSSEDLIFYTFFHSEW